MIDESEISFHEATVKEFYCDKDKIFLVAEDVWTAKGAKNAKVIVSDYSTNLHALYLYNDDGDEKSLMKEDDGEILTLKFDDRSVTLIVEWNNFREKKRETSSYILEGESVEVVIF